MSTDNYSNYKIYDQPDYFKDKEQAAEKMEEWWLNKIKEEDEE